MAVPVQNTDLKTKYYNARVQRQAAEKNYATLLNNYQASNQAGGIFTEYNLEQAKKEVSQDKKNEFFAEADFGSDNEKKFDKAVKTMSSPFSAFA